MKILLIAPEPFFEIRGTPLAILQLVKVLSKLEHRVDILTYHVGKDVKVKNVVIYRITGLPFIKYVPIGPSYIKLALDFFLFFKALRMCVENHYDVIHAVEESVFFGAILKGIFHIPMIYDMDSSISEQLAQGKLFNNYFFLKIIPFLEKWAIKNSTLVLTVCSSLTEIVFSNFPQKKVFQLEDIPMNNEKQSVSQKEVLALKKKLGLSDELIILYTGNFESYQGIDLLIRSIPRVAEAEPNIKILLVGGEREHIETMEKLATRLEVKNFLIFTGKMPPNVISTYMALADILASPRTEGTNTPLKIFTYLESGKPIVATNLSTHTQVLNENISMLVDPTPEGIAQGIISLLRDKELRVKMGRRGKDFVEENYSYARFVKKVREIYDYVLALARKETTLSGSK